MLGPRGRVVENKSSQSADRSIDDGNIIGPSPGCVNQEECREVHAECAPWNVDAELRPPQADATVSLSVSIG